MGAPAAIGNEPLGVPKCYTITIRKAGTDPVMSHESHHHHHHPQGEAHPPAAIAPSILRLSAAQRLGMALALIAVIWAAVFWAMRP